MSPDFYAKIFINGVATQTNREPDDRLKVEPSGWTASVTVDDAVAPMVPVTIQIWDHDSRAATTSATHRRNPTTTISISS